MPLYQLNIIGTITGMAYIEADTEELARQFLSPEYIEIDEVIIDDVAILEVGPV